MPVIEPVKSDAGPLYSNVSVAVAPTDTVMTDAVVCHQTETLAIAMENTDGSQELNAWIEVGPTSSGPWDRSDWPGLEQVAAGETRYETAVVRGRRYARIVGTASGAGLTANIWVDRVNN